MDSEVDFRVNGVRGILSWEIILKALQKFEQKQDLLAK